ncbi:MAG: FAD-dependent oxidoreductase [Anaerolineae bacterium]
MEENYDLVVIGAGAAGLTAAGFGGKVGARTALIERDKLGGDCTWRGCVPSKSLLKVAKIAHAMRSADQYGIAASVPQVNMPAVRSYIFSAIDEIYQHETPDVFAGEYGVDVILGSASFVDSTTIQVGERRLKARKIIIATGGRPTVPDIPGLHDVPFVTNDTLFENERLPQHLIVIGGGPIGMEMAQAYARLGAKVTVIDKGIFQKDEPEVAALMLPILQAEGIRFQTGTAASVSGEGGDVTVTLADGTHVTGDMLLAAVGRTPNTENLGLERAGVRHDAAGIWVDDYLRTSVKHIYAIGDCTQGPKFTHYAGFQGGVAAQNALLPVINAKGHDAVLPRVTFTEPEVAQVGLMEAQAREKYGRKVKVYHFPLSQGDRSVADNDSAGFIKIVYRGSGHILGATVVADRAGEMITEFSLLMKTRLKLTDIVNTMHAYPTYSDIVRKAISFLVIDELFKGTTGAVIKPALKLLYRK